MDKYKKICQIISVFISVWVLIFCWIDWAIAKPVNKLYKAKNINCSFEYGLSVQWVEGEPIKKNFHTDFAFSYSNIDHLKNTATMNGNNGSSKVEMKVYMPNGITFYETTPTNNLNFTTIYESISTDKKAHIAVHSRHNHLFVPYSSQYHGICKLG